MSNAEMQQLNTLQVPKGPQTTEAVVPSISPELHASTLLEQRAISTEAKTILNSLIDSFDYFKKLSPEEQKQLGSLFDTIKDEKGYNSFITKLEQNLSEADRRKLLVVLNNIAEQVQNIILLNVIRAQQKIYETAAIKCAIASELLQRNFSHCLTEETVKENKFTQFQRLTAEECIKKMTKEEETSFVAKVTEALELIASATAVAKKKLEEKKAQLEEEREKRAKEEKKREEVTKDKAREEEIKKRAEAISHSNIVNNPELREFIRKVTTHPNFMIDAFITDDDIRRVIDAHEKNAARAELARQKSLGITKPGEVVNQNGENSTLAFIKNMATSV